MLYKTGADVKTARTSERVRSVYTKMNQDELINVYSPHSNSTLLTQTIKIYPF